MKDKDKLKKLNDDLKEKDKSIEDLKAQVKEKDQEIDDYHSSLQRMQADFENYKKRNEKNMNEYIKYASEELILQIIDIYEDLERAAKSDDDGENLKEGIVIIYKNLKDVLKKQGLVEIPALGEKFDPYKHEALMTEKNEDYENGMITEELSKGYALNDKIIKYTMVKVCKK